MAALTAGKMQMATKAVRVSLRTQARVALTAGRPARLGRATRLVCMAVDKSQVLADVRSIIAEQLGTELEKVAPEAKFVDLGADSLDTVEIMMALEEKFDIQLDEEGAENISTVQEAADLIASQVANA